MIGLALGFLRVAWPYLLGAALLGGGYYWLEHVHCNAKCEAQERRADALVAQIKEATTREAAIEQRFHSVVVAQAAIDKAAQEKRNARFVPLKDRARSIPDSAACGVDRSTLGLLNDASRAANEGNPAAAAAEHQPAAGPVPDAPGPILIAERDLADFIVTAATAYSDAVGQWNSCVRFYNELRAQEKPQ
jgi:hypothetical protein